MGFRRSRTWILRLFVVCCMAVLALSGCRSGASARTSERMAAADYTYGQMMTIAATERNRYQNVYTSQLWSVELDESGGTFETKLKEQVERFLVELETVSLMAEEKEVSLSRQEKDEVKKLSQEYFSGLTQGDKAYMQVSQDEIYELYSKYYLAGKLVTGLTEHENLEVSDAEAKVIRIQQIACGTREEAEAVLEQVSQEKADFSAIAEKRSGDSQIEYILEWNENMDALEQVAFSLEQDEISGIIEKNGEFYIQKCVNAYDQEATAARKSRLEQEKMTRAFRAIYDSFAAEHEVVLDQENWGKVDFSGGEDCTSDNFFQLYQSYFGA